MASLHRLSWLTITVVLAGYACAAGNALDDDDEPSSSASSGSTTSSTSTSTGSSSGSGGGTSTSSSGNGGGGTSTSSSGNGGSGAAGGQGTGGMCSEQPCKVTLTQCGCAAGEKCTLDNMGTRICQADGKLNTGEPCTGNVCKAGNLCLGSQTFASCKLFCDTDAECAGPGSLCVIQVDPGNGPWPEHWCSANCDPITSTGCMGTGKCQVGALQAPPNTVYTDCLAAGSATQGQSCMGTTDCAKGYNCVDYNMVSSCAKWCNVASPSCPGAAQCFSFNTPMKVGMIEYGACVTP